tara:strand:+ start:1814 stop:2719 length:906 start_codon:yes stop_codon:yes gene_type:complete
MENDKIIFHVNGGIGKNIAATAVIKAIKKKYDLPITVVTGWSEMFKIDPNVEKVYKFGSTQYFYEDYIKRGNPIIFAQEPYLSTQHIVERKPLRQSWIEMLGMEFDNEMPELHFNFRHHQLIEQNYQRDKPTIVIHSNGGAVDPEGKRVYSWARDMPHNLVQRLVDRLKNKYHIFQICYNQKQLAKGAEVVQGLTEMEAFALVKQSKGRILIDSCIQHACGAMNLPSTVLWIGNDPKIWSYEMHDHITPCIEPKFNAPANDLYQRYDIAGSTDEYPYDTDEIFDIEAIISSVEKQINQSGT